MISRSLRMPPASPDVHQLATEISRIHRIVVQSMIPPELWAEVERRAYLTARGVLEDYINKTASL